MAKKKRTATEDESSMLPEVPLWILDELAPADVWVSRVNKSIAEFNYFLGKSPKIYGWRFRTKEAFDAEVKEVISGRQSTLDINSLYWEDTLNNLEAYAVMSVWRSAELLKSALVSLVEGETIVSAILSRSALETVVQFVDVARKVAPIVSGALKHDFAKDIIVSEDLESLTLKSVFSSRLPGAEDFYSPVNILTPIKNAAKSPGQEDIAARYAELCEVTHPNFLGRSVYVSNVQPSARLGDELRTLSRAHGPTASGIAASSIWAISWSAATQVTSALLMQRSVGDIIKKLKTTYH